MYARYISIQCLGRKHRGPFGVAYSLRDYRAAKGRMGGSPR